MASPEVSAPAAASPQANARASRSGSAAAVVAQDLTKVYPARDGSDIVAIEHFDLRLGAEEFVAIIGPSGCGKSTFLKMVAGLEPVSGGTLARGDGQSITGPQPDVGFAFQAATLLPWRSVIDNVMLPAQVQRLPKRPARERAHMLLRSVGLDEFENHYPTELSGGMQQRVAICRALLHDPQLLLMDEPFAALDALTRDRMAVELQSIVIEHRKPVLFVTHSIPEALFLADRVIVMSGRPGRVLVEFELTEPKPRDIDAVYAANTDIAIQIRQLLSEEAR
jgi:NitT/TauT family transport system ATP-binding protein